MPARLSVESFSRNRIQPTTRLKTGIVAMITEHRVGESVSCRPKVSPRKYRKGSKAVIAANHLKSPLRMRWKRPVSRLKSDKAAAAMIIRVKMKVNTATCRSRTRSLQRNDMPHRKTVSRISRYQTRFRPFPFSLIGAEEFCGNAV